MKIQKDPQFTPQDGLRAENNLLKLKLGLEHGMQMDSSGDLSPEVENQWLKSVYGFEEQFKHAKRIRLYDYIGQPSFKKVDDIEPHEVGAELERLYLIMENNDIKLSCICQYSDAVIYKFITEELFHHEMDDMRVPGMTLHFTYEEFHPNHDYDLRNDSARFIDVIFSRPWDDDYDAMILDRQVKFCEKDYNRDDISAIVKTFQEAHGKLKIKKLDVTEVVIEEDLTKARVHVNISVKGKMKDGEAVLYEGVCSFRFIREHNYWHISEFDLPGLSGKSATVD